VLAASILRTKSRGLIADVELPDTKWLEELRWNKQWLVNGNTAVTKRMHIRKFLYTMSARYVDSITHTICMYLCTQVCISQIHQLMCWQHGFLFLTATAITILPRCLIAIIISISKFTVRAAF
jgi:hypothetical protein